MSKFPRDTNLLNFPLADSIIFGNEEFVAIDKPAGILTIPDRYNENVISLYKILERKYQKIFVVHRLDRDTSGLVLFAKNEAMHKYLCRLFENREIEKIYRGIIHGSPKSKSGIIEEPLAEHPVKNGVMIVDKKGKPSITEYEILDDFGLYSLAEFRIHTGRTHQIRVHMQHIGHPLICDDAYGNGRPVRLSSFKKKYKLSRDEKEERPILNRLALHSYRLKFSSISGEQYTLTAELHKDMRVLLKQLNKYKT